MTSPMFRIALKELVQKRNQSLYRVASSIGVSQTHLYKMFRGQTVRIDLRMAWLICSFFNCKIGDLIVPIAPKNPLRKQVRQSNPAKKAVKKAAPKKKAKKAAPKKKAAKKGKK